jgi:hypothetical protein
MMNRRLQDGARVLSWLLLAAALVLPACKKAVPTTAPPPPAPAPGSPSVMPSGGGGGGVGAMLPSVGRQMGGADLKEIGLYYLNHASTGRSPSRLEDMADLKREAPKIYQAIADGQYVVLWNANLNTLAGTSNTILGYVKDAPTRGGVALFLDGSVRNITAQEFQMFAKAGMP